jgi:hypothetical protein
MLKSGGLELYGNYGCNPGADGVHPQYYLVARTRLLGSIQSYVADDLI